MAKLTKRIVEAALPREAPYFLWCEGLKGFGVRIMPSGARVYYVDYRVDGSRKRMAIGPHGVLTVEEARALAVATLGAAVKGGDPLGEKQERRAAITVAELCNRYIEAAERGEVLGRGGRPKKASTLTLDRSRIERHVKPLIGKRRAADLKRGDIARLIADVQSGKTATIEKSQRLRGKAVIKGGPGAAARVGGMFGAILRWGVDRGLLENNVAQGVRKPADRKRTRRLTPEEFGDLGAALAACEADGDAWQAIAATRLMALTGARRDEVLRLRWSEVDLNGRCLRLPDTKTGESIRPLGKAARDLLATIEPQGDNPFVFAGRRPGEPFGGWRGVFRKVVARAELTEFSAHILRHSFASTAADLGMTDAVVGAMLGHTGRGTTSQYTHVLDTVLILAADKVAARIAAMLAPTDRKAGEQVERMERR
jgi:integrase